MEWCDVFYDLTQQSTVTATTLKLNNFPIKAGNHEVLYYSCTFI